jgi:chemotaxis protein methyltransferase CheR
MSMHLRKQDSSQDAAFSDREFDFNQADFEDITARIYQLAGIVLKDHKKDMVYGRLARRLRHHNLNSFAEYRALLDSKEGEKEQQFLVNALTTNLTSFFRENHHFEHFHKNLVKTFANNPRARLRVWCSAASTGQEPYSIAMTFHKAGLTPGGHDVRLLATDLDTNVLEKGQSGNYEAQALDKLPQEYKEHFTKQADGTFDASRKLKDFITFKQLNLLNSWPFKSGFDVIFCRNVLIYFDQPTRAAIVGKMLDLLQPGGILYLGHSEAFPCDPNLVESEGHTIFRKL